MTIYRVTQRSWNAGKVSDFDLPRELGHFREYEAARGFAFNHGRQFAGQRYWTDEDDYEIKPIEVL